MGNLPEVNANEFDEKVLAAEKPTLVKFWAPWCGPCLMMNPIVESFAANHEAELNVVSVNVDETPEIAGRYGVMSIPTMILFKDGEIAKKVVGSMGEQQLAQQLEL